MRKFLIIFIVISVFILSFLAALVYLKTRPGAQTAAAADIPAAEDAGTSAEDAERSDAPEEAADESRSTDGEDQAEGETSDEADDEDEGNDEEPAPEDEEEYEEDGEDAGEEDAEEAPVLPKFDELLQVNPYVSGWLTIDGSPIDDPVVYTPGSQNYFLHRDIDGSNTSKGTLFIAINWREGFNNTLIYGHNMKNGAGFGSLARFADSSYGLNHSVIRFDTLYEEKEYELLGVFYSQIDEEELETDEDRTEKDQNIEAAAVAQKEAEIREEEGIDPNDPDAPEVYVDPAQLTLFDIDLHRDFGDEDIYREEKNEDGGRFRYWYYTDLADKDDFDYYVNSVKDRALYDTGVDAEWGDELITLSTCSYQVRNGRFVVVGVRKK